MAAKKKPSAVPQKQSLARSKDSSSAPKAVSAAISPEISNSTFDPYIVIKSPLSTEKSIRQIEFENKLVFVVDPHATKQYVKRAIEELFKVKVIKVNMHNSFRGQKRAYVKLSPAHLASDVSADLGLI